MVNLLRESHAFSLLQESRTYLKFDHALANEYFK